MKIKSSKIKRSLLKPLKKLWKNLFLILVLLLVLDLILGAVMFNKYYLRAEKEETQAPPPLKINEALLNQFSAEWQSREQAFQEAAGKQYPNPLRVRIPTE